MRARSCLTRSTKVIALNTQQPKTIWILFQFNPTLIKFSFFPDPNQLYMQNAFLNLWLRKLLSLNIIGVKCLILLYCLLKYYKIEIRMVNFESHIGVFCLLKEHTTTDRQIESMNKFLDMPYVFENYCQTYWNAEILGKIRGYWKRKG